MKLSNTLMMNESLLPNTKKAFTLAEVLITLSILGVVAALTIPTLVNRYTDAGAQAKMKKAIRDYENFAAAYMAENEATDLNDLGCANIGQYMKIARQVNGNCDFVTADGTRFIFQDTQERAANGPIGGGVLVYDSETAPRYGVVMWAKNGIVNGNGVDVNNQANSAIAGDIPDVPTGITPTNGYYNAATFLGTKADVLRKGTQGVGISTATDANVISGVAKT